jgi:hypothetical protein
MCNDKTQLTGAGLKKLILDCLPQTILVQMHTVDLIRKSDQEMIEIILKTGKVVEKWEEARKTQGTRTPKIQEKPEWK